MCSFTPYQKRNFRIPLTNKNINGISVLSAKGIIWKSINLSFISYFYLCKYRFGHSIFELTFTRTISKLIPPIETKTDIRRAITPLDRTGFQLYNPIFLCSSTIGYLAEINMLYSVMIT